MEKTTKTILLYYDPMILQTNTNINMLSNTLSIPHPIHITEDIDNGKLDEYVYHHDIKCFKLNDVRVEIYDKEIEQLYETARCLIIFRQTWTYYNHRYTWYSTHLNEEWVLTDKSRRLITFGDLDDFYNDENGFYSMVREHNKEVDRIQALYKKYDKYTLMDLSVFRVSIPIEASKTKSAAKLA